MIQKAQITVELPPSIAKKYEPIRYGRAQQDDYYLHRCQGKMLVRRWPSYMSSNEYYLLLRKRLIRGREWLAKNYKNDSIILCRNRFDLYSFIYCSMSENSISGREILYRNSIQYQLRSLLNEEYDKGLCDIFDVNHSDEINAETCRIVSFKDIETHFGRPRKLPKVRKDI